MNTCQISFSPGTKLERSAKVLTKRDGPWVVVRRTRADGAQGWHTWHFTRWGARRAARIFIEKNKTKGFRP